MGVQVPHLDRIRPRKDIRADHYGAHLQAHPARAHDLVGLEEARRAARHSQAPQGDVGQLRCRGYLHHVQQAGQRRDDAGLSRRYYPSRPILLVALSLMLTIGSPAGLHAFGTLWDF